MKKILIAGLILFCWISLWASLFWLESKFGNDQCNWSVKSVNDHTLRIETSCGKVIQRSMDGKCFNCGRFVDVSETGEISDRECIWELYIPDGEICRIESGCGVEVYTGSQCIKCGQEVYIQNHLTGVH